MLAGCLKISALTGNMSDLVAFETFLLSSLGK